MLPLRKSPGHCNTRNILPTGLQGPRCEISNANDALEKINENKYNDLGNQFEELGRNIKVDLIKPIGEVGLAFIAVFKSFCAIVTPSVVVFHTLKAEISNQ